MIQYKFRVWQKFGEYMMDHDELMKEDSNILAILNDTIHYAAMQYTNVKDIKGVEVCSGDIVKYSFKDGNSTNTRIMEVFHDGISFKLKEICRNFWLENVNGTLVLKHGSIDKYRGDTQLMMKPSSVIYFYEVIGNIYENPRLLKGA